jgi:hypothetical protein
MQPLRSLVCIGTLAALLAPGCGSSGAAEPDASQPAASPSVATVGAPHGFLGTYERTVSPADIARTAKFRHEGPGQEPPSPGRARLIITRSSVTFVVLTEPPLSIQEDYSATADGRLVINGYTHPDVGSFCGPEIPQNASYTWSRSGDQIRIQSVSDRCADRDSSLTGMWTRME